MQGLFGRVADHRRVDAYFNFMVSEEGGSLVLDVTDRRAADERIQRLNDRLREAIRETHYRVKNELQVLAAMVDIKAMDFPDMVPAADLTRLGQKIRTLAAVHDVLTHPTTYDGTEDVSVHAILERLVPIISTAVGDRDEGYHVDEIRLPLELVNRLAEWDLQGRIRYETRAKGGARVILSIPSVQPAEELLI